MPITLIRFRYGCYQVRDLRAGDVADGYDCDRGAYEIARVRSQEKSSKLLTAAFDDILLKGYAAVA